MELRKTTKDPRIVEVPDETPWALLEYRSESKMVNG
jgi:hypothetical protein